MKIIPPGKQLSNLSEPEWLEHNQLSKQRTFFPRSIDFEDIDKAVFDWFNDRHIELDNGNIVPAVFLPPEKWAEFKKQWKYMDSSDRHVDLPIITIRRSQSPRLSQVPPRGRIPGKTFETYRLPYYTPAGTTTKIFKVPQPIKVELEYEVRCLTHYMVDINSINETLLKHFASLQAYLNIDGHYMPMVIESINDETDSDDPEGERTLHTLYSITVNGYIIDKKEFEEKVGVAKIQVNIEEDTL